MGGGCVCGATMHRMGNGDCPSGDDCHSGDRVLRFGSGYRRWWTCLIFPSITARRGSRPASIGPFTINLAGISWLPGLGLPIESAPRLRKYRFAFERSIWAVTIFGMAFDLDILSAVITGVLALRWVFRS